MPTDDDARNRFLNYGRDYADQPKQRLRWNYVVDLPFGKGSRCQECRPHLNGIVGGWQLSSLGSIWTTYSSLTTSFWNFTGEPIHYYGYKYPIQNCTSVSGATGGQCLPGYLYYNGYIPANQINSVDPVTGRPNGYEGVPGLQAVCDALDYLGPDHPAAQYPGKHQHSTFWDTSNVWIPLNNGTIQRTTYNTNLNPMRNQRFLGPTQWYQDASLFESFIIREGMALRFDFDAFKITNHPNNNSGVSSTGFLSTQSQSNTARQLQLAVRSPGRLEE